MILMMNHFGCLFIIVKESRLRMMVFLLLLLLKPLVLVAAIVSFCFFLLLLDEDDDLFDDEESDNDACNDGAMEPRAFRSLEDSSASASESEEWVLPSRGRESTSMVQSRTDLLDRLYLYGDFGRSGTFGAEKSDNDLLVRSVAFSSRALIDPRRGWTRTSSQSAFAP
jgi:hypothetical protein